MKVKLEQNVDGVGGVAQVYQGLYAYLPKHGIEIVNDIDSCDVYHAHIGLWESVPPSIPLVVSSHGLLWDDNNWGGSMIKHNGTIIEAYRQADVVTTPSEFVAHAIARNMCISPLVVRHGIDSTQWLPGENKGYVLWNKARVDAANDPKDVDTLALMEPHVQFISTYAKSSSNVTVIGQLPQEELKDYIRSAGVYLDTPKESGGPCFGILEAMSCGIPILSWNYGGTPEAIVHKETGYLAEPGNYNDLLAGLHYCLQNRNRLGQAARETVLENYQWDTVITGYIDAYRYAIEKHQHEKTVSIIIPCYNLGRFLPACLDSVISQDFEDWEAIVIDDASTDNSLEIAHDYARTDGRIKVCRNSINGHVSYSRNRGIQMAKGKYILPLDADDRLAPHALHNMVTVLNKDRRVDIVGGKLNLYNESDLNTGWQGEWPNNGDYKLQITGYNRLAYSSMYRRKVWENVGGYRTRIRNGVEDADFWTRALSYGHRPVIIDVSTLNYTMRSDGLGKQNERGVDAWLPWFGWSTHPEYTPFGALLDKVPVRAYDHPVVSVVIPVGPGHEHHIQACIDSLLAQTFPFWEAVLINDTGKIWDKLPGMPFVKVINGDKNEGVAATRNKGILSAKSDLIVFLDVDDIAQPMMLELFLKAHATVGGWVYADWYTMENNQPVLHESEDWNVVRFRNKMLSPITGIYEKQHLLEAGLFDVKAPGWEDWDLQIALVNKGICGTRLAVPLITYNMQAGFRREENFSRAENLLKYIKNKYGDVKMACSKCGGKATQKVLDSLPAGDDTEMVLMQYTGPLTQKRHEPGGVTRTKYVVLGNKPFFVIKKDVASFLSRKYYKVVDVPKPLVAVQTPVLVSQETNTPEKLVKDLPLRPETLAFLKNIYSVNELKQTNLLTIKGIGPARAKEIQVALNG